VSLILGNLVLVQCQGIVVGFLASLAGIAMGWIPVGMHILSFYLVTVQEHLYNRKLHMYILNNDA
jgi:hypothetical protein